MKLGIVGSRRRNSTADKEIIRHRILELNPDVLISGGCPLGADRFAEELSKELGIPIEVHRPSLPKSGSPRWVFTKAYHARNECIAMQSSHLIALVASDRKGGTEHTISWFIYYYSKEDLEIL